MTPEEYVVTELIENKKKLQQITEEYDELAGEYNELAGKMEAIRNMIEVKKGSDYTKFELSIYDKYDKTDFAKLVEVFDINVEEVE